MPNILSTVLFLMMIGCFFFYLFWTLRIRFFKRQDIRIVTFSGPSGSGKTTIVRELLKNHPEWKMVLSLTSRDPRDCDLSGEYKCNVSREEFFSRERRDEFIWQVSVHGNMYGTLSADIDEACNSSGLSLMPITPNSVRQLRAYASDKVLSIFVLPPDKEELRRRLVKRGESPENIETRINGCKRWEEVARGSDVPYRFVKNDSTVENIVNKVESIINPL